MFSMPAANFNLRKAQSNLPTLNAQQQNPQDRNSVQNSVRPESDRVESIAMEILEESDVVVYLQCLRNQDVDWTNNARMKDSAEKLYSYLKENPLKMHQREAFTSEEMFFLLTRAVNTGQHPKINFIPESGKEEAFFSTLKAITSKNWEFIPPKTRYTAQWYLMEISIQSRCLSLALQIIKAHERPLIEHKLCSDVRMCLINASWDYLNERNTLEEAISYITLSTEICGLHPINTMIMMAQYCQAHDKDLDGRIPQMFQTYYDEACSAIKDISPSDPSHRTYVRALVNLQEYAQGLHNSD